MVLFLKIININIRCFIQMVVKTNFKELIELMKSDSEPAQRRKVILCGRDDLLTQAVHLFLESRTQWNVIRVLSDVHGPEIIPEITGSKPDVVILCQDRVFEDSILPLRLISEELCQKVVTVNLENNQLQVYSKKDIVIKEVSDLLCVIEGDIFSNCIPSQEVGSVKHT